MTQQKQPLPTCPMAETCKGMMEKPLSRAASFVPGTVLVVLGILIVLEPKVLAWVIAAGFVLIGIMLLLMAGFMRKISSRFGNS